MEQESYRRLSALLKVESSRAATIFPASAVSVALRQHTPPALSATSALSGFDFDLFFSAARRLRGEIFFWWRLIPR
jgi:hypothetical protein